MIKSNLKKIMKRLDVTYKQLEEKTGISSQTISGLVYTGSAGKDTVSLGGAVLNATFDLKDGDNDFMAKNNKDVGQALTNVSITATGTGPTSIFGGVLTPVHTMEQDTMREEESRSGKNGRGRQDGRERAGAQQQKAWDPPFGESQRTRAAANRGNGTRAETADPLRRRTAEAGGYPV